MRSRFLVFTPILFVPACDTAATAMAEPEPTVVDLVVLSLTAPERSGPGLELDVTVEWGNAGDAPSSATALHRLVLVQGSTEVEIANWRGPALDPGATVAREMTLDMPDTLEPGEYELRVQLAADEDPMTSRADNTVTAPIALLRLADLEPGEFTIEAAREPDKRIYLWASVEILNRGNAKPTEPFLVRLYLSADDVLDRKKDLAIGGRTWLDLSRPFETAGWYPADYVAPGTYHVFAVLDDEGAVDEWDESNNVARTTVFIPPIS